MGEFLQSVGDIDDPDILLFQLEDERKEVLDLMVGQCGGGFVHDHDFRIEGERFRYFNHLLLSHAERTDRACGIEIQLDPLKQLLALLMKLFTVENPFSVFSGFPLDKQVFSYRKMREEVEFLIDDADSKLLGIAGVRDRYGFSSYLNLSAIHLVHPGEDFHQRGFSCAVFSQEGMDFPGAKVKVHVIQCMDSRKGLIDILHYQ